MVKELERLEQLNFNNGNQIPINNNNNYFQLNMNTFYNTNHPIPQKIPQNNFQSQIPQNFLFNPSNQYINLNPTKNFNGQNPEFINRNQLPQNQFYKPKQYNNNQNFNKSNYSNQSFNINNFSVNQTQQKNEEDPNFLQTLKYVSEKYNNLINLNNINFGTTLKVKAQPNPRFFVIKSFTEEDIHKVIIPLTKSQ